VPDPAALDPTAIETRVELVELLGGEALVHVAAGPVELTARIPAPAPAVGARFRLRLPPDKVHLFDAVSTLPIES
jgi:ABC-type sugar transport system ATPase subunit